MDLTKIPIFKTLAWKVNDGYVVVESITGQLLLNETSSIIWRIIDGNKSMIDIINELNDKYQDKNNREYIEEVVCEAITEFQERDLIMLGTEDDMDGWLQYE